MSMSMVDLYSA